jgi:hypothetical protein
MHHFSANLSSFVADMTEGVDVGALSINAQTITNKGMAAAKAIGGAMSGSGDGEGKKDEGGDGKGKDDSEKSDDKGKSGGGAEDRLKSLAGKATPDVGSDVTSSTTKNDKKE